MTTTSHPRGIYITGTDTGVGKTWVSVALLHRLRADHRRAIGMKPVASGCVKMVEGWRNEDALQLIAASEPSPEYADANPFALIAPTAPQLAAREMGVRVTLPKILDAYRRLAMQTDVVVVEGVGGWAAALDNDLDQADLVCALDLSVVLVVGLRLGCLSHARLSARAIVADGLRLAGWIGNSVQPAFDSHDGYLQLLREALPAPCLGVLPHAPGAELSEMSQHLSLSEIWS